jgi:hypothetical protein
VSSVVSTSSAPVTSLSNASGSRWAECLPLAFQPGHVALASGWPIATGVVEGACRHLIGDRFNITGSRWSIEGAEAVLRLRALEDNGDIGAYWAYHLAQEHHRVHQARYQDGYGLTA